MEGIIILLLVILGPALVGAVFRKSAEVVNPPPKALEFKLKDAYIDEENKEGFLKIIEAKGVLPLTYEADVCFVTSVLDVTDGEPAPVISSLDNFQEPDNVIYQDVREVGRHGPGVAITKFINVGAIIPDIMTPPRSGPRKLAIMVRLMEKRAAVNVRFGFFDSSSPGIFELKRLDLAWNFKEKGYKESAEHREQAAALTVQLGVVIAMADGSLDESEGKKIKEWIIKNIAPFEEPKKSRLKAALNDALKNGFEKVKSEGHNLDSVIANLNEIADKNTKYEAVELCFDVMAADGVADESEMKAIKEIAIKLGLNMDRINAMRDQRIVSLDADSTSDSSVESMLGIDPDWSSEDVRRHLRKEFSKWNNRLNTLSAGPERDSAQRMLDSIAELRKKYG